MTREQLRQDNKFMEWLSQGQRLGYMGSLAKLVDHEIGNGGYPNTQPHMAHINLGVQEAVRRVRTLLESPMKAPDPVHQKASYGVTNEPST